MYDHNRPSGSWPAEFFSPHKAGSPNQLLQHATQNIATIYNQAGGDYIAYADGDTAKPFVFNGVHAYADSQVWLLLDHKLADLRASGASAVSILDAGCGPGIWLFRLVTRAHALGFTSINARGFDIAQTQIRRARRLARSLRHLPGVNLSFDVADLTDPLPEADASVDIVICLYSVLNHLPVANLSQISAEIGRVTAGHFIATARATGSTPTALVDSIEKVRHLRQDHSRNRCEIELSDGRRTTFRLHLFTAAELQSCFASHLDIKDLRGLDLFHCRFAPDSRWNPDSQSDTPISNELAHLEEIYAGKPEFMDRAAHLLLVGRGRHIAPSAVSVIDRSLAASHQTNVKVA